MKTMILPLALTAMCTTFCACNDDEPVLEQRDWNGTTAYFSATDEDMFGTYYKPAVGYVADPMPFYDPVAGNYKVMYLQDYDNNQEATYHPIWGVSTTDAASYTSLGELLSCGGRNDPDAALGTGGVFYDEIARRYYTFYTGNKYQPQGDECGQVVMAATSADFKTWTKDRTVFVRGNDYGYDRNEFRDPHLFYDDEGVIHMVVATIKDGTNVVADFTSQDLKTWISNGELVSGGSFYECPDVFRMGNYWYLVYSDINDRKVHYRMSATLEGLKDAASVVLEGRAYYAAKTASDGTIRYLWGWCPRRSGFDNGTPDGWAGNLVAHRVSQREDGSLSLLPVEGIDKKFSAEAPVEIVEAGETVGAGVLEEAGTYTIGENAYALFSRLGVHNKISFKLQTSSDDDAFGISFVRGTDSEKFYTIRVQHEDNGMNKANFEEEGGKGYVLDYDFFDIPQDHTYNVTVYTDNSVCVTYINGRVAFTNRIYGLQKNCWSLNCYKGSIRVTDLKVSSY